MEHHGENNHENERPLMVVLSWNKAKNRVGTISEFSLKLLKDENEGLSEDIHKEVIKPKNNPDQSDEEYLNEILKNNETVKGMISDMSKGHAKVLTNIEIIKN